MPAQRSNQSLLLELQDTLSADLFASAAPLRLATDEALFLEQIPLEFTHSPRA